VVDRPEQPPRRVAIRPISSLDEHRQQMPLGIHQIVSLAPVDIFFYGGKLDWTKRAPRR
jgi:hypothetical protein